MATRKPVLHPYGRISDPTQRKGGGLERQTTADLGEFARRFDFSISKRILVDDGVSAFKGLNASPDHELGKFLSDARRGLIPRGDCLLVENYDRISREDPWAAIGLVSELRSLGIHVGRLDRMKLLRSDSNDYGDFFEAAVEFMRGNSESKAKSMRNGAAWERKRQAAREGKPMTSKLPLWVRRNGTALELIPERAAVVREIFRMAGSGYGLLTISRKLDADGVPAFGPSGKWSISYLHLILKDRRAVGELQPKVEGKPAGEPIPDYFPRAVSDAAWAAARAGAQQRDKKPGRVGKRVNLFTGLLKGTDGYSYVIMKEAGRKSSRDIIKSSAHRYVKAAARGFPLVPFEEAILRLLSEIDPHSILNGDAGPDETLTLGAQLAVVEDAIKTIDAELDRRGESPTLYERLRKKEAHKKELTEQLAAAREKARHPLSETWGEAQTLMAALAKAPDPRDARLRLRAAFRRMIDCIILLVVRRGRDKLCAVQVWFTGGKRHRDFLIFNRPQLANPIVKRPGFWKAVSLAAVGLPEADLRKPADAARREKTLRELDLELLLGQL
jgi:DNA invertase Pin-like site-specific DNA recombinase